MEAFFSVARRGHVDPVRSAAHGHRRCRRGGGAWRREAARAVGQAHQPHRRACRMCKRVLLQMLLLRRLLLRVRRRLLRVHDRRRASAAGALPQRPCPLARRGMRPYQVAWRCIACQSFGAGLKMHKTHEPSPSGARCCCGCWWAGASSSISAAASPPPPPPAAVWPPCSGTQKLMGACRGDGAAAGAADAADDVVAVVAVAAGYTDENAPGVGLAMAPVS